MEYIAIIYILNFRNCGSGQQDLGIVVEGKIDFGFGKGGNGYSYGKKNDEEN
jgi:hypothetical protein